MGGMPITVRCYRTSIAIPDSLQTVEDTVPKRVFATILAIALLRVKSSSRASSWRLIERKALKWLQTVVENPEFLISHITALI
jgi:hypothetical protein